MERSFNKIVLVSLCDFHSRNVGMVLAQNLDMFFCDAKDLVEYELVDKDSIKKFCTMEYLQLAERNVFKHIASFENVVVTVSFDEFVHNYEILKEKSLIVFLKFSLFCVKESGEKVNSIVYENRTAMLAEKASLIVEVESADENILCDKIIKELGGIL